MSTVWDPAAYLAFDDHRARPFHDLLHRVAARTPRRVVDLGCGPGTRTLELAARWPVEVHLAPHRDVPDLVALGDDERDELADVYLDLLARLDRYHRTDHGSPVELPYIAGWHQAPVRTGREVSRLHLQITSVLRAPGTLKYLAGSEAGAGAFVNDTLPEETAADLRERQPHDPAELESVT